MGIQARIPPGLAAVHNFIMKNDDTDIHYFENAWDPAPGYVHPLTGSQGDLVVGVISNAEKARAEKRRDDIAEAMWNSYQEVLRTH
ncbi:hypothetical protein GGU10DRAFT_301392, partial [Lentinula aff. detonsa]